MRIFSRSLFVLIALFSTLRVSYACDFCAVYTAIQTGRGERSTNTFGIAEQFTHFESNVRPLGMENFPGQHVESSITQLYGTHWFSESVALQLNVPIIRRDYRRIMDGAVDKGSENGLGDISILGRYQVIGDYNADYTMILDLIGGLKLPTGDAGRLREELNMDSSLLRHGTGSGGLVGGHDLALGSGSVDFQGGASFLFLKDRWSVFGNGMFTARQSGSYDYRLGHDFQWNVGPGYYFGIDDEWTFATFLRTSGELKGSDTISGATVPTTSEAQVFVGPEIRATIGDGWFTSVALDIPVTRDAASEQVVPQYRILAAASYRFS